MMRHSSSKRTALILVALGVLLLCIWRLSSGGQPPGQPGHAAADQPGNRPRKAETSALGQTAPAVALPQQAGEKPRDTAELLQRLHALAFNSDKNTLARDIQPLLASLSPQNMIAVAEMLETVPDDLEAYKLWDLVLPAWAAFDGQGAFTYALQSVNAKKSALCAMESWVQTDPEAPRRYIASIADADQRRFQTKYITGVYLRRDPAEAMKVADESTDPVMRAGAAAHVARTLTRHPENRPYQALAGWLGGRAPSDAAYHDAVGVLASSWVTEDPAAATAWATGLPEGPARARALRELTGSWAGGDPEGAGRWLNTQPASPDLDPAISEYAVLVAQDNAEFARGWAQGILDPKLRDETLARIAALTM